MDSLKSQQLSLELVDIYLSIEEEILKNIAKKIGSNKILLEKDINSWQFSKLNELGMLQQEQIRMIAQYAGRAQEEIANLLTNAGYAAVEEIESDMKEALKNGAALKNPAAMKDSTQLFAVLNAYELQAKQSFNLVNTTILNQSQQVYLDIINQTTAKVLTGVYTGKDALREVSSQWAERGVPALIDKKGRRWSTEAYVNMITRSVSNNVANDMQEARMDEYDIDLIEVSSHSGARPLCAPYQGRIFSRSGKSKKYPALSSTSYGKPAGLKGVNCGHKFYPYIPGFSKKTYKPYDQGENAKTYRESQIQRAMERDIRKSKRKLMMMEQMKDNKGIEAAKQEIRDKQSAMREFINDTGRTRRYNREKPY
ncbi:minor capsid protein [Bacillus thuringiensis]|uniref:phage minor capsid protein n=1 Tax=Bacillus thuringiensis TaxID=1428 RepID=UPI000BF3B2BE|nr:phage minor capsid protein [Bacillus thuringiensis]PEV02218.1 minor capsid protein [Bacillus thuringiensis]